MLTDRELLDSIAAQIHAQAEPPPPPPPAPFTSPTGREPRLLWTPRLQAGFARMQAQDHPWARLILTNAAGNRYGDTGLWATLAYQMTGEPSFVARALTKLQPFLTATTFDDNSIREYALERVIMLDWLWPGLTDEQRALFLTQLDVMFTDALKAASLPATMPLRVGDSDQVTGVYMGLAAYHMAFGGLHAPTFDLFNRPFVGGLDSTGRDRTTLRNCIRDFVAMAAGGEWIESGEYNLGTVRLLVLGAEAIRTATGIDHFPEVTAWKTAAGPRYRHFLTPDLKQSFQWGDDQEPHAIRAGYWVATAMCFDDPDARLLVADLVAQYGATGINTAEPAVAKGFLLFDPYGPTDRALALVFDASAGQGIVTARTSQAADASQLMVHMPPTHVNGTVDHAVRYFGDVQVYRKGAWALTHPITYGGPSVLGPGCNVMLHCGFGSPLEFRGDLSVTQAPGRLTIKGTARGSVIGANYYQIPNFWYEHTRSITWISGEVDTIIVEDVSNIDAPEDLLSFLHYSKAIQAQILAAPLRQWLWHAPVAPVVGVQRAEWPIPSGVARVSWSRPDIVAEVVDQRIAWAAVTTMAASEKRWHLSLTPPEVSGPQTLTTVLEFGDPAKFR